MKGLKEVIHAGWLAPERERQLSMLSVDWEPDRTRGDADWDARLTELLAFRRQRGHVQVLLTPSDCTSLVKHVGRMQIRVATSGVKCRWHLVQVARLTL